MRLIKRTLLFGAGLALGLGLAVFIARNREAVSLHFYFGRLDGVPVWAVVVWSMLLGGMLPLALYFWGSLGGLLDHRRLEKRIEELEEELVDLRNLPLTEARLDLDAGLGPRPLKTEARVLDPEVMPSGASLREADRYPSVVKKGQT